MPLYVYKCFNCEDEKEVMHSMADVDEMSKEVVKETTCFCLGEGTQMIRVPQEVMFTGDKLINNKERRDKFQKERRKRGSKDFQDNVMGDLAGSERKHFMKKHGYKDRRK